MFNGACADFRSLSCPLTVRRQPETGADPLDIPSNGS